MPLQYDSSAIRYESTQQAYGCTWTLNKIESDGAQVWKNSQGQEAIVPKEAYMMQKGLQSCKKIVFSGSPDPVLETDSNGRQLYIQGQVYKSVEYKNPPLERSLGTVFKIDSEVLESLQSKQDLKLTWNLLPGQDVKVELKPIPASAWSKTITIPADQLKTVDEYAASVQSLIDRVDFKAGDQRVSVGGKFSTFDGESWQPGKSIRIPEVGCQRYMADGPVLRWDGTMWRNVV